MRWSWWNNLPLRVKGFVVVALPIAALLAVTSGLYLVRQTEDQEQETIRQILRVRSQIQTVLSLLLDAETGVRGYNVSEDRSFLKPYEAAFDELPSALANLEQLTGEDPDQASRARQVRFLAGKKLEVLAMMGRPSFAKKDFGPENPVIQQDDRLMSQLRTQLTEMQQVEEQRLAARLADLAATRGRQPYLFGGAILFGLAGGLFAMWLFTTGVSHRVTRIEESAHRLARGEELLNRPPGTDEVGRLAAALDEAAQLLTDRERQLRFAKETAEQASTAKSDFLSRTTHELRTPLTAIRGIGETLYQMEDLSPTLHQALGQIVHASHNLEHLLNDFLDISRIEAGVLEVLVQPIRIGDVLPGTIGLVIPRAREKGVNLETRLVGYEDLYVVADPQRLQQIVLNLVVNAIKYNEPGALVVISCTAQDGKLRINVTDNGPGIPPEDHERLFLPYERLQAGVAKEKGLGLGLPISRSLAELMNGRLEVESKPGSGSTFWVELPTP